MAWPAKPLAKVAFHPDVVFTQKPTPRRRSRPHPTMPQSFEGFKAEEVTDEMMNEASQLFSEHYGIWGPHQGAFGKPGT